MSTDTLEQFTCIECNEIVTEDDYEMHAGPAELENQLADLLSTTVLPALNLSAVPLTLQVTRARGN